MTRYNLDIVIIGYNEGLNLDRTIKSVKKATSHVEKVLKIKTRTIYVDSNSTDDSMAIVSANGLEAYFANPDYQSVGNGRTSGYLLTDSEYLMFLDGDSELKENWLIDGINYLETWPKVGGVVGIETRIRFIGNKQITIPNFGNLSNFPEPISPTSLTGSGLYRRKAIDSVGGYEPDIKSSEDRLMHFHLQQTGWVVYQIPYDMVTHWDIHFNDISGGYSRFKQMVRRASTSGALIRYGFRNPALFCSIITSMKPELLHLTYMAISAILIFLSWRFISLQVFYSWVALTAGYFLYQSIRKHNLVYGASALILQTVYVFQILFTAIFNCTAPNWGVQKTKQYKQHLYKANNIH